MKRRFLSKRALIGFLTVAVVIAGVFTSWKPLLVRYRIGRAREALESRDGDSALELLQANEQLDPDHAETQFLLARAYRRLGRFDKVHDHIERAWKLGYPVETLKREQWLALAQTGQLHEAERHLSDLLKDPRGEGREICEAFVSGYLLNYRFQTAYQLLDAWQKDYPQDPYPYVVRGKISEVNRNLKQAIKSYRRALELDSSQSKIRLRLAHLLLKMHHQEEARKYFQRCLKDDPDNLAVLTGWSQCLSILGRHKEAREVLKRVLERTPGDLKARVAMGNLELSSGHPKQALRWLKPVATERPHDSTVRYALAQALQRSGQTKAAKKHFKFASDAQQAYARIQILVEQLGREPNNAELRYKIGSALLPFEPANAAVWLRSAVEIDPNHRQTHEALAAYYSQRGLVDLARLHRKRAEQLKPNPQGP